MNQRNRACENSDIRLFDMNKLCAYLSLGENHARELAERANAVRHFGRSIRFDKSALDDYLDSISDD